MDIQIEMTPEKAKRHKDPYSTPPHSGTQHQLNPSPTRITQMCQTPPHKNKQILQTPRKSSRKPKQQHQLPPGTPSAVKRRENPQSKKQKPSPFNIKHQSPFRYDELQQFQVSAFTLTRLEQDYSLVQHLGSGHFSNVGLYRSRLTGEHFAIKTAKANRMSVNEVQALGSLWMLSGQCPHVVRYYHSWVEDGQLFLVMEYCQESLQKHIARFRAAGTPMPEKLIINYLRAALMGLASIHKHGILHLDVKPENILFKGNTLKLADFGLSRAAQIRTGEIQEGDSRYLAKEVLNLQAGVDLARADIFSLAMTAYEMLTLEQLPNNGEQWLRIREMGVRMVGRMDLTNYSEGILDIVERMGAVRWQDRPSAMELLQSSIFKQSNRVSELFAHGKSNKKREVSL